MLANATKRTRVVERVVQAFIFLLLLLLGSIDTSFLLDEINTLRLYCIGIALLAFVSEFD